MIEKKQQNKMSELHARTRGNTQHIIKADTHTYIIA